MGDIFKVFEELEKEFFGGHRGFPDEGNRNDHFSNRGFPFGFIGDIPRGHGENFPQENHQSQQPKLLENKRSLILKSAKEKEEQAKIESRVESNDSYKGKHKSFPNRNFRSSFSSSSTSIKTLPDGRIEETTTITDNNGTRTETKIHNGPTRPRPGGS